MYYLRIRWAYDDEDVESFPTKEALDARIAYLLTLPKHEGVTWKVVETPND
jgi:hypothetical protein